MKKLLGMTADGARVIDREHSHLHQCAIGLLEEALSMIRTNNRAFIEAELDFGQVIGMTSCVSTTENDMIIFGQREKRNGLTRFVLDREMIPSTKMMVILKRGNSPDEYILITAFVGGKPEPEPWDKRATQASFDFWESHALVWTGEQVMPGTLTAKVPW